VSMTHEAGQVAHMPSRRLSKDWRLKGSNSPTCSPVPMKITGALVAATALSAPPTLISVVIHLGDDDSADGDAPLERQSTWSNAASPMLASMTRTTRPRGLTASATCWPAASPQTSPP
jgi:hypothetical protein